MNCFKSNGKFMLTGEYLVLKGAVALALPLKLGQSMNVETLDSDEGLIYWNAYLKSTSQRVNETTSRDASMIPMKSTNIDMSEHDNEIMGSESWFSVVLDKNDFSIKESDDYEKAKRLSDILSKVKSLNEDIFNDSHDYRFSTLLDFDSQWGLGSSSTLINNVAEWANIDPYQLLGLTFKGSGYDIACAKANGPIFYETTSGDNYKQVQRSEAASFYPDFKDNLYFVYLGHKQNSSKEVKAFLDKDKDYTEEIKSVSEISRMLPSINDLDEFCRLMNTHEDIIASCIGRHCVREDFKGFEGIVKSLGAWGGDFILAASKHDENYVKKYFENKGLDVIIKYKDIVLDN